MPDEGITVQFLGEQELALRFAHIEGALQDRLVEEFTGLGLNMQTTIVRDKLAGRPPGVLNRRSGKLADSVHPEVTAEPGAVTLSIHAGKEAPYGAVHEYGMTIPAHEVDRISALGNLFTVHMPDVTMPERSFMRSTLGEYRQRFLAAGRRAMVAAAAVR